MSIRAVPVLGWMLIDSHDRASRLASINPKGAQMTHDMTNDAGLIRFLQKVDLIPTLHAAVAHYLDMDDRKARPEGTFDNANRFYLKTTFKCCEGLREPSRAYPWSQMVHAKTAIHVAHQFGIADRVADIRAYAKWMRKYPALRESLDVARSLLSGHEARMVLADLGFVGP
jgi:hypothetical protein